MRASDPAAQAFFLPGNAHGCLLIHGFTGTAGQLRFVAEGLNRAGYTVSVPMLPGHGKTPEAMIQSNWEQWLEAARTSYIDLRKQCERVSVMGLSMGGALALILAEEYPVDSVVSMSAPIRLRNRFSWAAPLIALFQPYRKWAQDKDQKSQRDFLHQYHFGYDGTPMAKIRDLRRVVHLAQRNLFAVVAPALVIQSELDETVAPASGPMILSGIGSKTKKLVRLERSGHMCVLDCERQLVLDEILFHLRNIGDTKSLAN